MNSPITFPPFAPKLQLARRTPETPSADPAAQPRALQTETQAAVNGISPSQSAQSSDTDTGAPFFHRPGTGAPMQSELALQTGWDQLKRARAILEAEQRDLRDQRMAVRDLEGQVARREAALAAREKDVSEREARVAVAEQTPPPQVDESAMKRLTRAPFEMARSVFGAGNK